MLVVLVTSGCPTHTSGLVVGLDPTQVGCVSVCSCCMSWQEPCEGIDPWPGVIPGPSLPFIYSFKIRAAVTVDTPIPSPKKIMSISWQPPGWAAASRRCPGSGLRGNSRRLGLPPQWEDTQESHSLRSSSSSHAPRRPVGPSEGDGAGTPEGLGPSEAGPWARLRHQNASCRASSTLQILSVYKGFCFLHTQASCGVLQTL